MRLRTVVTVLAFSFLAMVGFSEVPAPIPQPYNVAEAYRVYSVLLPGEESYGFATKTIVIREESVIEAKLDLNCISKDAAAKFKDAIDDYSVQSRDERFLQRSFESEKPYEIVNSATIQALMAEGGWKGFYKRFPDSGGYHIFSAVGFNKDKTLAVVYSGSSCEGLCGRWSFHLLERVDRKWRTVPGVQCMMVS